MWKSVTVNVETDLCTGRAGAIAHVEPMLHQLLGPTCAEMRAYVIGSTDFLAVE